LPSRDLFLLLYLISEVEGRSIEAFSIFKKGIRPEWEDEANKNGAELVGR
jgi:hypothetical protein